MAKSNTETFEGVDSVDDWVVHFRLEKMSEFLKDFGVTCVADLADLYGSVDLIAEVEKKISQIEFNRFKKAAALTTHLAGIPFPALGEMIPIKNIAEETLLEEEEALKEVLEKTRTNSTSASRGTAIRIDLLKEEVELLEKKEREEALKKTKQKAIKVALESKLKKTRDRKMSIIALDGILQHSATVDFCILMDCTRSMSAYMEAAKSETENVISKIKEIYPNIELRLAFVAYRDHCNGANCLQILTFDESKSDITIFRQFVASQKAHGGCSHTADVFGGIKAAADLDWQSATRLVFHIGDAPCHGRNYHDGHLSDPYPSGHPNDVSPSVSLNELANKQVSYFFGRLNRSTDAMIMKFNDIMGRPFIQTEKISSPTAMMAAITKSATISVTASISTSVRSGASNGAHKMTYTLDPSEPNWCLLPIQAMNKFSIKKPLSLLELMNQEDDDCCVESIPIIIKFKVNSLPFGQGGMRAAFKAKEVDESSGMKMAVVHKFSLSTRSKHLTREAYEKDLAAHRAASFLAEKFSAIAIPLGLDNIRYVVASIGQDLTSKGYPYFIQEELLNGTFEKFNSNTGFVEPCPTNKTNTDHSIVQAFSHWTYHVTNGKMMVIDCQGVYIHSSRTFQLTDPAVHCSSLLRFEPTNMGAKGVELFFATHKCNYVCRSFGLHPH